MIIEYIFKFHLQDCIRILSEEDILGYYNITIDFLKLFETYPDVGDKVLCNPIESLPACHKDIVKAQQKVLEEDEYKNHVEKLQYKLLKRNVHARFFGLPVCPELHRTVFPKNVDLGCFLKITGTVVRVTQAKMLEYQRKYVCMKCKHENEVVAEFENRYILKAPGRCANEDTRCKSSTFSQVPMVSREYCKDYQEIKIQEMVNKLSIGTIPGSMWVVLENDLVDSCKPGDDVNICGTVRRRWRPTSQNKKAEVELVLQANYVEVCNSQRSEMVSSAPDVKECFTEFWSKFEQCPLKGRDRILASVCPQVYGLHLVKLAVLLTVITGSNHVVETDEEKRSQDDTHTTRVRGQCHLLLVGDPGTGKSQLLKAGAELTARSVFTSGAGSTRAGLTCAALREDGEWQLEAGALVLADGGVCCVDEVATLRDHDRTAVHEAMEQQTISIAKAGIVCKLNTRCAVIAACNPKGHYQTDQPLSVNVSLGTPLLSRFDLIFILLDSKNKAWDKLVSSYILFGGSNAEAKKEWSLEKLQMYISLVGPRPTNMTKAANIILRSYYMMQRKSEYRDPSRTTVRMLDSLVRLSQAHCRLMYRTTILPMDAVIAVSLVDLSMQDCTLSDTVDALHSNFQRYPDFDYLCTAKKLLTRLGLDEIWRSELLYYGNLLQVDHKTLENDINRGQCHIFSKYDDVTDDNISLSASLVTSSYFDNKKSKQNQEEVGDCQEKENMDNQFEDEGVSKKFADTLKKHSTLNKSEKRIQNVQKRVTKRKKKEVTVDVQLLKNKVKKSKTSKKDGKNDTASDSDEELPDPKSVLNAVPSVNDIFADIEMDFKIENSNCEDDDDLRVNEETQMNQNPNELSKKNKNISITAKKVSQVIKTPKRAIDQLKQFKFTENHDLNKFYEEKSTKISPVSNKTLVKVEPKEISSVSTSQTSIFETSNCDLVLDELTEEAPDKDFNNKGLEIMSKNKTHLLNSNSQVSIFETSDCDILFDDESSKKLQTTKETEVKLANKDKPTQKKATISNSQISIFETSDCDIDLDL